MEILVTIEVTVCLCLPSYISSIIMFIIHIFSNIFSMDFSIIGSHWSPFVIPSILSSITPKCSFIRFYLSGLRMALIPLVRIFPYYYCILISSKIITMVSNGSDTTYQDIFVILLYYNIKLNITRKRTLGEPNH